MASVMIDVLFVVMSVVVCSCLLLRRGVSQGYHLLFHSTQGIAQYALSFEIVWEEDLQA